MAKKKNQQPSEPGLIRVHCPDQECDTIHRIPINLDFTAILTDEGSVEIDVIPDPDMSQMVDHMAFEHGWL